MGDGSDGEEAKKEAVSLGRLHMRSAGGAKGNDATAAAAARGLPAPRAIVVATSSLAIAPHTACQIAALSGLGQASSAAARK